MYRNTVLNNKASGGNKNRIKNDECYGWQAAASALGPHMEADGSSCMLSR